MNEQEFISSGALEAYILGFSTPEESSEVERMSAIHPEIKAELEAIEDAMNEYTSEQSIEPPSYLKEKILGSIQFPKKVIPLNPPETINSPVYLAIAATFLFLISGGFAIYFGYRSIKLDNYLDNMAKINTSLSDSIRVLASNQQQMENDLAVLKDPMYKLVELKGMKPAPDAKAMVCWCPMDKKLYIEVDKLPTPPKGMEYQLWAIVDGKPVSEGMLTLGTGLHRMPDVDKAEAFAVTLEKEGGSPTPQGDMYVKGTI